VGYNSVAIFMCLAVVASQICEILQKFELTAVQGHPRSRVEQKHIYDLLLVINSNFGHISYLFRVIDVWS